jgi:hypothetical protein
MNSCVWGKRIPWHESQAVWSWHPPQSGVSTNRLAVSVVGSLRPVMARAMSPMWHNEHSAEAVRLS